MIARRSFLKRATVAMGISAAVGTPSLFTTSAGAQPASKASPLKLGIAGYTFKEFKLEQALQMLKQVDVHYLCIKDFHLPLDSSAEQIAAFHEKCKSYGVTGYGVGPIYMGSEADVDKAFDYAKRVGVKTIVGVPHDTVNKKRVASPTLLKYVDKKVKEYDVHYAIHNHGPDMPELFPTAESVMEMAGGLDKRIGLCLDIGHELRFGFDPVQAYKKFADRVYDMHIKNVTAASKAGRATELPRGLINFPQLVRALRQEGYAGVCSLEFEKDMSAPLPGVAESIGYFRGVMDSVA